VIKNYKFIKYEDMKLFWEDVQDLLEEKEWYNNLMIRNCNYGVNNDTKDWLFGIVKNNEIIEMIVLFRPPWKMVVYSPLNNYSDEIIIYLANEVYKIRPDLLGINTEKETANKFAKEFCRLANKTTKTRNFLRILLLEKIIEAKLRDDVIFRKAVDKDKVTLKKYLKAFTKEALHEKMSDERAEEKFDCYMKQGYYVLEKDGKIVAQAVLGGIMKNGNCVSCVFTPKEERGKKYAYNLVYRISKEQLDNGNKFCVLYTDDTNPISNYVYEKIGYKRMEDWEEIDFI